MRSTLDTIATRTLRNRLEVSQALSPDGTGRVLMLQGAKVKHLLAAKGSYRVEPLCGTRAAALTLEPVSVESFARTLTAYGLCRSCLKSLGYSTADQPYLRDESLAFRELELKGETTAAAERVLDGPAPDGREGTLREDIENTRDYVAELEQGLLDLIGQGAGPGTERYLERAKAHRSERGRLQRLEDLVAEDAQVIAAQDVQGARKAEHERVEGLKAERKAKAQVEVDAQVRQAVLALEDLQGRGVQVKAIPTVRDDFYGVLSAQDVKTSHRSGMVGLGGCPEGVSQRRGHGGPELEGPFMWTHANTRCSVISADGRGSAWERAQLDLELSWGEPFTFDGVPGAWMLQAPGAGGHCDGDHPRVVPAKVEEPLHIPAPAIPGTVTGERARIERERVACGVEAERFPRNAQGYTVPQAEAERLEAGKAAAGAAIDGAAAMLDLMGLEPAGEAAYGVEPVVPTDEELERQALQARVGEVMQGYAAALQEDRAAHRARLDSSKALGEALGARDVLTQELYGVKADRMVKACLMTAEPDCDGWGYAAHAVQVPEPIAGNLEAIQSYLVATDATASGLDAACLASEEHVLYLVDLREAERDGDHGRRYWLEEGYADLTPRD